MHTKLEGSTRVPQGQIYSCLIPLCSCIDIESCVLIYIQTRNLFPGFHPIYRRVGGSKCWSRHWVGVLLLARPLPNVTLDPASPCKWDGPLEIGSLSVYR